MKKNKVTPKEVKEIKEVLDNCNQVIEEKGKKENRIPSIEVVKDKDGEDIIIT